MLERLHYRLGTAGLIVAVIALVVALGGGAYAASQSLTGKQKKEVKKIAKKFAGKRGPAGATGPVGPAGAAGPQGGNGSNGQDGAQGPEGPEGPQGDAGEDGSPWTAGGTLPPASMETGTWSMSGTYATFTRAYAPVSFSVPLSEADAEAISEEEAPAESGVFPNIHVLAVGEEETANCPGTVLRPEAVAGHFCVYTAKRAGLFPVGVFTPEEAAGESFQFQGVSTGGAILMGTKDNTATAAEAIGSWAVTAPE